jgi:ribosome-associated translation inhibitor RaiA
MRIEVIGEGTISQQARTYAEYRVFAALTQFPEPDKIEHVRVLLRSASRLSACENIACTVTVGLKGSDFLRIRATGPHAYAAINRAVERIRSDATERADRVSV